MAPPAQPLNGSTASPVLELDHDLNHNPAVGVRSICCVGAGYVGGPTASVVAFNNPQIRVTVADLSAVRIRRWNSRHPPIYEPGLRDVVRVARDGARACKISDATCQEGLEQNGEACSVHVHVPERQPNLFFTTDVAGAISGADVVMIAVNTPTKYHGVGSGIATDMTAFEAVTGVVAQHARPGAIIVEKSTVPVRTARLVHDTLALHRPGVHFEIVSNPEFLAAGSAVKDLLYPDRILVGSEPTPAGQRASDAIVAIYAAWIPRERIITTNVYSSELAKLVANAMLAQRISSINSISAVCEATGADVDEVARAIGCDPRIGNKFLRAGIGFGGSCFKKDILSLVYLAETAGLDQVGEYWRQVVQMNEYARDRFTNRVIRNLNNTLVGKKITILGFAFKKNTSDTREPPALEMIRTLLQERPGEVAIYDPCCNPLVIKEEMTEALGTAAADKVIVYPDGYAACRGSTAVIIATEFDEFSNHDRCTIPARSSPSAKDDVVRHSPGRDHAHLFVASKLQTDLGLLDLHRHLLQTAAPEKAGHDDPLNRFHQEPSCEADCPDCRQPSSGVGMGSAKEYQAKERLDWTVIAASMSKPKWLFDGRGVIDAKKIVKLGVRFESVGRQASLPA